MELWIALVYTILGSLSMISGIGIIPVYVYNKSFRKNPGMLIFWHIISQMILDGVVVFIGIFNLTGKKMPKGTCSYTGTINTYFFFLGFNYFICLSIEVLIKIKKPMNLKHKKRLKVYHFFCHFAAFAVTLSVALEKEIGASFHQRCVINYRSQSVYLLVVPVVVYLPVLISTLHMACRLTKDRSFFNYFFIKWSWRFSE